METNDQPPPAHIRLVLGERASAALSSTGENAFIVVSRGTTDDRPGAWVCHILPCSIAALNDAARVARGEAKARRVHTKPTS